tara:strand:+ start:4228 stop:6024 length:1797 start_codon:yes stop_codon:yes gene_type:complete
MSDDQKKIIPIDYTHRDFSSIRGDLLEVAERLYPDSFQDFSEASFGALMIDSVAYIADQLSFYLDYNVNESFLDTAYQYNNVVRHGRVLGYKYTGRPSTYGQVALYILIPASTTGLGPDSSYLPVLKRGSRFTSNTGLNFVLTENIDFADSKYPMIVARTDAETGAPTYFAVKAYGNVVSGHFGYQEIDVGPYERYKRVRLSDPNISEIISIVDSEGNEYFEVDYLAQDMVYKEISNKNYKNDNVPSIMKPFLVSRKFVTEFARRGVTLQFGSGKSGDSNVVASPQSVAMDIFGKDYVTDTTFDPTKLSKNENFGIVPVNTKLRISYRVTNPLNSNVSVGGISGVSFVELEFSNMAQLSTPLVEVVRSSIEVLNETPIVGEVSTPTTSDIKRRIFDTFPTQNRAVTKADYENLASRMPAKFGSIKRVSAQQDPDARRRNINLYVLSEDSFEHLTKTNSTIKNNLKVWLNNHRMVNDTIDIVDPFIINLGIEFIVRPKAAADRYTLLERCVSVLTEKFNTDFYIGEPVYISDIYEELKKVKGALDVIRVKLVNKTGQNYSGVTLDINRNLSPDGTHLVIPKNAIAEIKFPATDIQGKIR